MTAPLVKGWCPGAHRPMASGDGLIVRVKPFRAEMSRDQVLALCDVAHSFGNGILDLTSRANLQIRGVSEDRHGDVLRELSRAGLLDQTEKVERHRNILMPFDWRENDETHKLHDCLLEALDALPDLPGKMGFALDTSDTPQLRDGSADFRVERGQSGLILRADGASSGTAMPAEPEGIVAAIQQLAEWFVASGGQHQRRMARHLKNMSLPEEWQGTPPQSMLNRPPEIGYHPMGQIIGAAFGKCTASALQNAVQDSCCDRVRLLLDRKLMLLGGKHIEDGPFVFSKDDPVLNAHACPGAPYCAQATVETLPLARTLVQTGNRAIHVSGCAKGCAYAKSADLTLIGRDGRFDLVRNGTTWDTPHRRNLHPNEVAKLIETM